MAEKKGNTGKLKYPFNTAACLEIQLPNMKWYRVTCNEFRSHNSPRRISQMKNNKYITEEYIGPIYLFGTNTVADLNKINKKGILFPNDIDPRQIKETRAFGRL
jgi:hypothetical protein